jgi:hypothetical protein
MKINALQSALLVALGLGLAACAPESPIRTVNYSLTSPYDWSLQYLQWAAASGPVWLEVRDSPYPGGDAAMAQALVAVSSGKPEPIRPNYTVDPAQAGQRQMRVVYAFYPGLGVTSWQVCDPRYPMPHQPLGERLELMVAFCFEAYPISALSVSAPPLPPGDQTGLHQVAERAMIDMFREGKRGGDLQPRKAL